MTRSTTRRLAAAVGVAAAALLAIACGNSSGNVRPPGADPDPEDEPIAVEAARIARGPLSSLYTTSATLRAERRATITARTEGVVKRLLVEEGDFVKTGQELAVLEDDEQRIELDRASAVRDTTGRELERARSLHDQGLISEEEFETTRRNAEEARQQAAMAELMLSRSVIKSPFGGRVLTRHLDVGATVSDGTPVFDLADLDPLYADVTVPERHVGRLRPGQPVRLFADAAGEEAEPVEARIERIAPAVDPATGTVKVTLAVDEARDLRPGSFVRVEIVTDTHERALIVPRSALVAEGRRWFVFRLGAAAGADLPAAPAGDAADGEVRTTVERIEVERGYEERDRVEILADTVAEGDRIVVTGASALTDGASVRLLAGGDVDPA